jgi:hypothetical protein
MICVRAIFATTKFAIKGSLCSTQYFYIVDSDMTLNNTHGMCCCLSIATVVARKHHNLTVYVQ